MPDFQTNIQIEQEVIAWEELFLTVTGGQVSKIGANSIVEGFAYTTAKLGQLINKDILNLRADNSPDLAFGTQLDNYALRNGYAARFGAIESSTFLFLHGAVGTIYLKATHFPTANNGEVFILDSDVTIGNIGFDYVKIKSQNVGANTNVGANSITKINPSPTGHVFCSNDVSAYGGRDAETDIDMRNRLKQTLNILSIGTLAAYEQIFQKINPRVLNLFKGGHNAITGAIQFYVSSVNGIDFTNDEFDAIITDSYKYLSITEQSLGIELFNINYLYINISMRVDIQTGVDINRVRVQMQRNLQRKYDYRYLKAGDVISRNDLILLAASTNYVKRVLTSSFYPVADVVVPELTLVRFKSFILYDLAGNIITDNNNSTSSVYSTFFANYPDYTFQQMLSTL